MDAGKRQLSDIFNGNRILQVPYFQRSYVWDVPQWERLLEDMVSISVPNKPYFLGSVILKQEPTQTNSLVGDIRTIIDGQQRLTTLQIFFRVLWLKTNNQRMLLWLFRLMANGEKAMQHNHNDEAMFDKVMNLNSLEDLSQNTDRISKAYTYFKDNIDETKLDSQNIINNLVFIGIDVAQNEDEQQIFDTINSLGVTLSTGELLKNYFFKRDYKSYKKYWEDVFELNDSVKEYWDGELFAGRMRRTMIDLFFYAYLQIAIQDISSLQKTSTTSPSKVKADDKIAFARVDSLFQSYKDFIKDYDIDTHALLEDIKEYANIFKSNIDKNIVNVDLTANAGIERMNALIFGLENTTLIPYFLFILRNQPNQTEQNELFDYIEKYIMRRIVCGSTNKNYNNFFTSSCILNKCLTKDAFEKATTPVGNVNDMPNKHQVQSAFESKVYYNNTATSILYFIESKTRGSLQSTSLLGLKKYSLEHMMPKKWRNNWGRLATQAEEEERDRILLLIGNLTIIQQSLNASIRDDSWQNKLNGKKNNGLRQYATGISITTPYLSKPDWNETEIINRSKDLYKKAISIWAIDSDSNTTPAWD